MRGRDSGHRSRPGARPAGGARRRSADGTPRRWGLSGGRSGRRGRRAAAHHEQLAVVRRQEVADHLPRRGAGRCASAPARCARAAAPRTAAHRVGRSPRGAASQAGRERAHAVEQGRGLWAVEHGHGSGAPGRHSELGCPRPGEQSKWLQGCAAACRTCAGLACPDSAHPQAGCRSGHNFCKAHLGRHDRRAAIAGGRLRSPAVLGEALAGFHARVRAARHVVHLSARAGHRLGARLHAQGGAAGGSAGRPSWRRPGLPGCRQPCWRACLRAERPARAENDEQAMDSARRPAAPPAPAMQRARHRPAPARAAAAPFLKYASPAPVSAAPAQRTPRCRGGPGRPAAPGTGASRACGCPARLRRTRPA